MPKVKTGLTCWIAPSRIVVAEECFETCQPELICAQQTDQAITSYNYTRFDEPTFELSPDINAAPLLICLGGTRRRLFGFKCGQSFHCNITPAPHEPPVIPPQDPNPRS